MSDPATGDTKTSQELNEDEGKNGHPIPKGDAQRPASPPAVDKRPSDFTTTSTILINTYRDAQDNRGGAENGYSPRHSLHGDSSDNSSRKTSADQLRKPPSSPSLSFQRSMSHNPAEPDRSKSDRRQLSLSIDPSSPLESSPPADPLPKRKDSAVKDNRSPRRPGQSIVCYSSSGSEYGTPDEAEDVIPPAPSTEVISSSSSVRKSDVPRESNGTEGNGYQRKKTADADEHRLSTMASAPSREVAYIPHLPSNRLTKEDLEKSIRQTLEMGSKLVVDAIQCYPECDLGIVYLQSKEDKDRLVNGLRRIFITSGSDQTVSFVGELEVVSYLVIRPEKDRGLPSPDQITERLKKFIKDSVSFKCEVLCPEFPNIYRLTGSPFDELIGLNLQDITDQKAAIYHRTDCSFFVDLSEGFKKEDFYSALGQQISEKNLTKTSAYIQFDPSKSQAVVLTSGRAGKWSEFQSIVVNGHKIEKRKSLKPSVVVRERKEEEEINAANWYESRMSPTRSNIFDYLSEPTHPIFRWKWNPQEFLQQFDRWKLSTPTERDRRETESNEQRHLLRMTVMLNTVGIVKRGKYSINGKDIRLRTEKLKTIVYNHQSKLEEATNRMEIDFSYSSTKVEVFNEDCLIIYERLLEQGFRPLLLNMANAKTTGGGYRKGDGAQEENLFRRSNYYRSLDIELDDGQPTERSLWTSTCVPWREKIYPIDDFGAIYTSGLTFFRHVEEKGYALMDEPVFDVSSLAIAAYRDPRLTSSNLLAEKYSIGTRKKIETIFAIGKHHQHDCLLLSAFGCGAFHNPPQHMAQIFKSVIEQYAGFFKKIVFAIIDDHNAAHGNYRPFDEALHGREFRPIVQRSVGIAIGPWRIVSSPSAKKEMNLSEVRICSLPLCRYGAKCREREKKEHWREFLHPSRCPFLDVCPSIHDESHSLWFEHPGDEHQHQRSMCPWTPFHCQLHTQFSEARDPRTLPEDVQRHCREFLHVCRFGRHCTQNCPSHEETTVHIARRECREGRQCSKLGDETHLNSCSHAGIADIRRLCRSRASACPDREKVDHHLRYRHNGNDALLSVIPFTGSNSTTSVSRVIRSLFPVYQCSKTLFETILLHGHLMSPHSLNQLNDSDRLRQAIEEHPEIQSIIKRHPLDEERIRRYIKTMVSAEKKGRMTGEIIRQGEESLRDSLNRDELSFIARQTLLTVEASINLAADLRPSSEKHLRTVLGPTIDRDGGEIVLILKREVLHHPEATLSLPSNGSADDYRRSKFHCSILGYEDKLAEEISKGKKNILQSGLEGHLPDFIPLGAIDEVSINKTLFDSLKSPIREIAQRTFGQSLKVYSNNSHRGMTEVVNEHLLNKHRENIDRSLSVFGTVITLPPSDFSQYVRLPFTLGEVTRLSKEIVIYWQSISGELIIALSQRPIDDQQNNYLVCHIAPIPSTKKTEYVESSSYLTDRDPREHRTIVKEQQFLAHSKVFHRACDLENPLTYCLKLEKSNGHVTLSHAGPNSLYNQEKITYRFSSSKFDLNYIQISAGSQSVSVRNLLVSPHEIEEFHPSLDEHFQRSARRSTKEAKAAEPIRSPSGVISSAIHSVGNFLGWKADPIVRTACRHSVNCREQGSEEHCRKYSHPCRFSELCRNREKELHLTHEPHRVDICGLDKSCHLLDDPRHRARCRHTDLPDFLIPCRDQPNCRNTSSQHRIKYSHGEEVSPVSASAVPRPQTPVRISVVSSDHHLPPPRSSPKIPCRLGSRCHDFSTFHQSYYSH